VFVQPKIDIVAKVPPKLAELADKNRKAQTIERAPNPTNPLPFSRGNSADRVIADADKRTKEPPSEQPKPASRGQENGAQPGPQPAPNALPLPTGPEATMAHNDSRPPLGTPSGVLSDAIRHVERYTGGESLQNVQGNGDYGPSIQFDTKGVEFGPWLRRFIAQIKRNWFVPYAAMSLHGHVVLQFNVHKSGAITDLRVVQPSAIDAFTNSAFHALQLSNPTMPLPPEYPDEQALFTVTFYFNETPPGGGRNDGAGIFEQGRKQVDELHLGVNHAGRGLRCLDEQRDPNQLVVQVRAVLPAAMVEKLLAMVCRHDDDGVPPRSHRPELADQRVDRHIDRGNVLIVRREIQPTITRRARQQPSRYRNL